MLSVCRRGRRHRMVVGLQLPVKTVTVATKFVSSSTDHGETHSIQHYVIKFVSALRKVGGFIHHNPILMYVDKYVTQFISLSNVSML